MLMGIWRVTGSSRLQGLAVRSTNVFNCTLSDNKFVCINYRMGMKFANKFIGTLVVKSQLFKLVKGVFIITSPTDTQKDAKFGTCDGSKFTTEMWIGSDEFGIG
eukprot:1159813-Pelagomonas_calceolata.AAC.33